MSSGIYLITNTLNGRRYVGSAVKPKARWGQHLYRLRRGRHINRHLQSAYDKYGEAVFVFETLEDGDREFLTSMEQWWMNMLRPEYNILPTSRSGRGYHHTPDAVSRISAAHKGRTVSAETRARISEALKGKSHPGYKHTAEQNARHSAAMKGRKQTPETIAKRAAANKGKHGQTKTPEWRAKISASMMGKKINLGRKHSDEIRARMSEAKKSWWAAKKAILSSDWR